LWPTAQDTLPQGTIDLTKVVSVEPASKKVRVGAGRATRSGVS